MTTESADHDKPQTLDDLVPLVGDIIDHTLQLQRATREAVTEFQSAAGDVDAATSKLSTTQEGLTRSITEAVGTKFDDAINGAAVRIGAQLGKAEDRSKAALDELNTAVKQAVKSIHNEANSLHAQVWFHLIVGGVGGLGVGILGTIVFVYFR